MAKKSTQIVQPTHDFKVGDILAASWGYSMIRVDFYKVLKVTPKSVKIAHIGSKDTQQTGYLSGTVMPDPDTILEENCYRSGPVISAGGYRAPVKKQQIFWRRPLWGYVTGHNSSAHASKWDGQPMHFDHCD
jgi:hypothetical protein